MSGSGNMGVNPRGGHADAVADAGANLEVGTTIPPSRHQSVVVRVKTDNYVAYVPPESSTSMEHQTRQMSYAAFHSLFVFLGCCYGHSSSER